MSDKEQLTLLINSLKKALKHYSVKDITEAVDAYLSKKNDKHPEIHFVLEVVASEFNTSKRMLTHSRAKGQITVAQKVLYCVMHYNLKLSVRYISKNIVPRKSHCSAFKAISEFKTLNDTIKTDREFKEVYDRIVIKLSEFIANKGKEEAND